MKPQEGNPLFSVGELNQLVKSMLGEVFGEVRVQGEVSGFVRYARSGHWYFSLKDDAAQIRCAMFAGDNRNLTPPRDGDRVVVAGRLGIYVPRGDYQLVCTRLQRAGEGALMQRFMQLKARLTGEGLLQTN